MRDDAFRTRDEASLGEPSQTTREPRDTQGPAKRWTILTKHGIALVEIARLRDLAATLDVTERTAQTKVSDLAEAQYITRTRAARGTRYAINRDKPMRHSAMKPTTIDGLYTLLKRNAT
jgi:hypothetical protein